MIVKSVVNQPGSSGCSLHGLHASDESRFSVSPFLGNFYYLEIHFLVYNNISSFLQKKSLEKNDFFLFKYFPRTILVLFNNKPIFIFTKPLSINKYGCDKKLFEIQEKFNDLHYIKWCSKLFYRYFALNLQDIKVKWSKKVQKRVFFRILN